MERKIGTSATLALLGLSLLLAPAQAAAGSACVPRPEGLVSWWPGDGNWQDAIGGNHGQGRSDTGFAPGLVGLALALDGRDDHIDIPDADSLDFDGRTQSFTLEAQIFRKAAGIPHVIFDKTSTGPPFVGYRLLIANDRVTFRVDGPDNLKFSCGSDAGAVVTANAWHHVVGQFDAASTPQQVRVYLNGVLQASCPYSGSGQFGNAVAPRIGAFTSASGGFFGGLIDELALYRRALSAAEIAALSDACSAGKCKGAG